jgi:hypothetical protein
LKQHRAVINHIKISKKLHLVSGHVIQAHQQYATPSRIEQKKVWKEFTVLFHFNTAAHKYQGIRKDKPTLALTYPPSWSHFWQAWAKTWHYTGIAKSRFAYSTVKKTTSTEQSWKGEDLKGRQWKEKRDLGY